MQVVSGGIYKWLYHGIYHWLKAHDEYPDRYYVVHHQIPTTYNVNDRSVATIGTRAYKIGSLISVNKYELK
jgi:hypothetical protein